MSETNLDIQWADKRRTLWIVRDAQQDSHQEEGSTHRKGDWIGR